MRVRSAVVVAVITVGTVGVPASHAGTMCSFGGPTPGHHVVRLDLPRGSSYLNLRLTRTRPTYPVGDRSSWHLAQGIGVLDARTGKVVAARFSVAGTSPRRVVTTINGTEVLRQETQGFDAPFVHQGGPPVPHLKPGRYLVVAFGSDGDRRLPNPVWGAEVGVSSNVTCVPVARGEVFDFDQTNFTGGTHLAAYGPGVASDIQLRLRTARRHLFGLVDAQTQGPGGTAEVVVAPPRQAEISVSNTIAPFSGTAGEYRFRASYSGAFPAIAVAGVAFDL